MSREEKEKLLNEKMENIRKRNEELRKRHEEIEADKKNADKFSSTVTMDKVKPYVMKTPRARPEKSERPRELTDPPPIPRPSDIMPTRQRLSENDGPPPDPSYRFLSDPDRDGNERERKRDGRGKRKGRPGFKGPVSESEQEDEEGGPKLDVEEDVKLDARGNFGDGRGKPRYDMANEDQKHGWGRGRGKERGGDRSFQEDEYGHPEDSPNSGGPSDGGRRRGRGRSSFASRDIRYYPDDDEYQRVPRDGRGRGRGRQNYNQYNYSDENQNKPHRQSSFEYRGRGRGRSRDKAKEYERWKAERAAIDEARLTRGKTDGGSWRREWDNDKMNQGEREEGEQVYDPRYPRSKSETFKLADLINLPDNKDGAQQQDEFQRERRFGSGRGSREKFVKVDTEHLKHEIDDTKDSKRKVDKAMSPTCIEISDEESKTSISSNCIEISDEETKESFYDDKEKDTKEDTSLPPQDSSSPTELIKDGVILDTSMDSGKDLAEEEVNECCDDKSYEETDEGRKDDSQLGAVTTSLTETENEIEAECPEEGKDSEFATGSMLITNELGSEK